MRVYKVISLLAVMAMVSCNPFISKDLRKKNRCNNKLERLVEKCPALLRTDTIIKTVEILVPEIRVDTFILTNTDVSGVDSIVSLFSKEIDSLTALKLTTQIKWYIKDRPCLLDTLAFEKYGVQVKVYQDGNEIRVSFYKPEEIIEEDVEIPVETVKLIELTIVEQVLNFLGNWWKWLIFIVVVAIGLFIWKPHLFNFRR